jgi:hypothetical protein
MIIWAMGFLAIKKHKTAQPPESHKITFCPARVWVGQIFAHIHRQLSILETKSKQKGGENS